MLTEFRDDELPAFFKHELTKHHVVIIMVIMSNSKTLKQSRCFLFLQRAKYRAFSSTEC